MTSPASHCCRFSPGYKDMAMYPNSHLYRHATHTHTHTHTHIHTYIHTYNHNHRRRALFGVLHNNVILTIGTCVDDKGAMLEEVRQSDLETVIPKTIGSTVVVVLGRQKGQRGKLLDKSSKSGGTVRRSPPRFVVVTRPTLLCAVLANV